MICKCEAKEPAAVLGAPERRRQSMWKLVQGAAMPVELSSRRYRKMHAGRPGVRNRVSKSRPEINVSEVPRSVGF